MALPHPIFTTPDEYLQLDRHSPVRHEYVDGHAYALAGGSLNHSAICIKLGVLLYPLLRGTACRVYNSDARVRLSATRYVYPDLTISCAPQDQGETDLLTAPRVVIEVLSPSTEVYDRGDKFAYYRACATVNEYALVASDRQAVQVYRRPPELQTPAAPQEELPWEVQTYAPGEMIALTSIGVQLPFDEIYVETSIV
ncbi:MAG TPA: Uma2 family endonuclease [Ktedonobacterales bacterium]|nr:Uma2 family endonuclease [Ktedonobacterales bacterium]